MMSKLTVYFDMNQTSAEFSRKILNIRAVFITQPAYLIEYFCKNS